MKKLVGSDNVGSDETTRVFFNIIVFKTMSMISNRRNKRG